MQIFIVIAAFNEGRNIHRVIRDLRKAAYRNIVVVDDGSKDNTWDAALREGVFALRHIVNRGQGAALRTGIDFALEKGADIIVTFDADGQHRVEDIPSMIKPVMQKKVDVTLGSRFLQETDLPWFRKLTLKIAVLVVWVFYGVKMTDAHNGFRAFSRRAAQQIAITADRMDHASQIVEEIHKKNIKYQEIPVVIKYTDYSMKHGHGGFTEALRVLWSMLYRKIMK
jgi:glycosyltransferase involved in cell wall biosynthesis